MITAFVLLDVEVARVAAVADELCDVPGVREVYSVTGRYDLIVKVAVAANEELADVVTGGIARLEGITSSETVIAFRTHSPRLLDEGFALGD